MMDINLLLISIIAMVHTPVLRNYRFMYVHVIVTMLTAYIVECAGSYIVNLTRIYVHKRVVEWGKGE